jgi:sterol desaturase/sphingolipid hydroxylase (fatty acid hydroxylase superfamily)
MSELIAYAIPVFLALLVFEAALSARHRRRDRVGYELRDTFASLAMGVGNVAVSLLSKGWALALFAAAYRLSPFDPGTGPLAWAALLVLEDLCYYGFHRAHHEVRFFWAAHVNHHSSRHFNLSTALRQSWTTPFTGPWFWLPLALLGFHPLMIVTAQAVSLIYQFWIHTEWIGRLGPLEWVLNTPSHHRVHHGRNVQYLDRNYAGILIVWDRLFGSFEPEGERVDYGLTKNLTTHDPLRIAFHEWAGMLRDAWRARGWRTRLSHLLQPPGWSPDGSSLTARQMRALRLSSL